MLEDEDFVAFLDARPLFPGHVLLVPREHVVTIMDAPREMLGPLAERTQDVARAVQAAMASAGIFTAVNNVVSQSVPHLHVHVVPRNRKDGLRGFFWPRTTYASDEEAADVAARIQGACASASRGTTRRRRAEHLALREGDSAAQHGVDGVDPELRPVERRPALLVVVLQVVRVEHLAPVRLHDREVRVGADPDGALARGEAEEPSRRRRHELGDPLQRDVALVQRLRGEHGEHELGAVAGPRRHRPHVSAPVLGSGAWSLPTVWMRPSRTCSHSRSTEAARRVGGFHFCRRSSAHASRVVQR